MAQAIISIKTNEEIKKEFNNFCEEIGLNMSATINLFMKTVIREQKIPFEVSLAPNKATIKAIEESEDILNGKMEAKVYDNVDELFKELDKE